MSDRASAAIPRPRYSFSRRRKEQNLTHEPRRTHGEYWHMEGNAPAIMISHSTSSSTPFGRNRLTSPIILRAMSSCVDGIGSEEAPSGRARRMKVSSVEPRVLRKCHATAWDVAKRRSDLLSSSRCHFSIDSSISDPRHPSLEISKGKGHTLHLTFLVNGEWLGGGRFQQLGAFHPFVVLLDAQKTRDERLNVVSSGECTSTCSFLGDGATGEAGQGETSASGLACFIRRISSTQGYSPVWHQDDFVSNDGGVLVEPHDDMAPVMSRTPDEAAGRLLPDERARGALAAVLHPRLSNPLFPVARPPLRHQRVCYETGFHQLPGHSITSTPDPTRHHVQESPRRHRHERGKSCCPAQAALPSALSGNADTSPAPHTDAAREQTTVRSRRRPTAPSPSLGSVRLSRQQRCRRLRRPATQQHLRQHAASSPA